MDETVRKATMSPSPPMLLSPARKQPPRAHPAIGTGGRGGVSDLCTLAPWDELACFRKEVQAKLEEALAMALERREGETRLKQSCQQIEAKVERFARQTRGLHSRSEVFEGHLTGQAKELDASREAHETLRDKLQRSVLECATNFNASMSSLRSEVDEAVELRHESALETCRRGDRAIADELLKKMGELNEKLGANMLSLEEELATDFKKFRSELERQDRQRLEGLAASHAALEQRDNRLEAKFGQVHGECREMAEANASATERMQNEHGGRLGDVDIKLAKLHEQVSRLEGRMAASELASSSKFEQLKELVDDAAEQTAAGLVRVRSEAEGTARDAVRASREELREDMRSMREELAQDLVGAREDTRLNLTGCRELAEKVQQEAANGVAELKGDFRTLCRDVCGMVEDVQQQVASVQTEAQVRLDSSCQQVEQQVELRLKEVTKQLTATQEELRERSTGASDQLTALTATLSGTQQRLVEVCASVGRLQASTEEVVTDLARCQTFAESSMAEVRYEVSHASERQDGSIKRLMKEAREDGQRQLEIARSEGHERASTLQKDSEELAHRLARMERSVETQVTELREQLRERLRESAHDWTKLHAESQGTLEERLQGLARQSDSSLTMLRGELAKAAASAREARAESERTCHRFIEEVVHNQEKRLTEALAAEREASNVAAAEVEDDMRRELQAIRVILSDQAVDSATRTEQLAIEVQKQTGVRTDELKHIIEELDLKFEEQFNGLSATSRHSLRESQQEMRQHVLRQLEERLRPLSDKLTETAGEFKATKRSEKNCCERLQTMFSELVATQDSLGQQCSATSQEVMELRVELRGGAGAAQARQGSPQWRAERSAEHQSAFRDEFHLHEAPTRLSSKFEAEAPARVSARFESSDIAAKHSRNLSQDRWCLSSSTTRHKPRASFEAVMGASPLRLREGPEAYGARRSRTPSPTHMSTVGGREQESWTFGREHSKEAQRLGSPRGLLTSFGGRSGLTTSSPPRSPKTFRTSRGSYL